jgi:hypothetical protein
MSPTPVPPPEEIERLLKDSTISGAMGVLAMLARLLMSSRPSPGYLIRHCIIAFIVGFFGSMLVRDYIQSVSLQFATVGVMSYLAPEMCDFIIINHKKALLGIENLLDRKSKK